MAGSVAGGLKAAKTNKSKHGKDFYVRIGRQGGRSGKGHAFAHGRFDPAEAGKRGGRKSRRGPLSEARKAELQARKLEKELGWDINFKRVDEDRFLILDTSEDEYLLPIETKRSWKDKWLKWL